MSVESVGVQWYAGENDDAASQDTRIEDGTLITAAEEYALNIRGGGTPPIVETSSQEDSL